MGAFLALFAVLVDVVVPLTASSRAPLIASYRGLRRTPCVVVPHGHYRDVYRTAPTRREPSAAADSSHRGGRSLTLGAIRPDKKAAHSSGLRGPAGGGRELAIVGGVSSRGCGARSRPRAGRRASPPAPFGSLARGRVELDAVATSSYSPTTLRPAGLGAALLALSLDRPVLMPDGPTVRELREQVGEEWVKPVRGSVNDFLTVALSSARRPGRGVAGPPGGMRSPRRRSAPTSWRSNAARRRRAAPPQAIVLAPGIASACPARSRSAARAPRARRQATRRTLAIRVFALGGPTTS